MLDGGRLIARLIGDDGEVVVRSGVARINLHGTAQQVARVGGTAGGALQQREVDERLDIARIFRECDAELGGGGVRTIRSHQRDAKVVVRLHVLRIESDRPLKLLDRIVHLPASFVQKTEIVVDLRARIVLLEQRTIVCERAVEVADALIVQGELEMIFGRRRRGLRWLA